MGSIDQFTGHRSLREFSTLDVLASQSTPLNDRL